jgi:plastocyanin
MPRLVHIFGLGLALLIVGCGKKPGAAKPVAQTPAETPAAATNGAAAAPAATASAGKITGKATFSGTPPAAEQIRMDADPYCKSHSQSSASETVVVGAGGGLKNVLVYLKKGYQGKTIPPAPAEKALLDQVDCRYVPHVMGVRVGQAVTIRNSDGTLHNVHASGQANQEFNLGQPVKGMTSDKTFSSPEVTVHFKCDVHPWMGARLGVFEHPWFAVTGDDGSFTIADVPAGTYTVEAWHETLPAQTAEVTVSGAEAAANFTFQQ